MPVHYFTGFGADALQNQTGGGLDAIGGTFNIDPGFDNATDGLTFFVRDNDGHWSGDSKKNEKSDDGSAQRVKVSDANGNTIANGAGYIENSVTLTDGNGNTITLYRVEVDGVEVGYVTDAPLLAGVTYTVTAITDVDNSNQPPYSGIAPEAVTPTCFTTGARIMTPGGEVPVEALRAGDRVLIQDGGTAQIRWIGARRLTRAQLDTDPSLLPVELKAGVFGLTRDARFSAQHGVLVETPDGTRLIRARHMVEAGIRHARIARGVREVTYHHLFLDRHALVLADGMWSETLYPGPMALRALAQSDLLRLIALQPRLMTVLQDRTAPNPYGPPVHPYLKRREALALGRDALSPPKRCHGPGGTASLLAALVGA